MQFLWTNDVTGLPKFSFSFNEKVTQENTVKWNKTLNEDFSVWASKTDSEDICQVHYLLKGQLLISLTISFSS